MASISVAPLGYALGAEARGLDLRVPLTQSQRSELYAAWLRHLVLVFPGQDHLTPEEFMAFSRNFGDLDDHPRQPAGYLHPDHREILLVTNRPRDGKPSETRRTGRNWHADLTYTLRPAKGALLLCREKPKVGGDTMWSNMHLAYETLSEKMRNFIDDLECVHSVGAGNLLQGRTQNDELLRLNPPAVHPLVLRHPETGRKGLRSGQRIQSILGLSEEEGANLLGFLNQHAVSPEFTFRHRWSVGDIVLWDNRSTQHLALPDFDQTQHRTMYRCSLIGETVGRLAEVGGAPTRETMLQELAAVS